MKKYLIVLLLCVCHNLLAQVKPKKVSPLIQARIYLNKSNPAYDPAKAFEIYQQCANEGNARAMNILAILYSEGTGTTANQEEALKWFERSAKNGYDEAWFNLGNMYRAGLGTEQDFRKAFKAFEKGAAINSSACMYSLGYMFYKGLGCDQNYEQAITLFRKGIKEGSLGSMYMLGICFRNGYGIHQNTDSARYWLSTAAAKGYRFAKEELNAPEPENMDSLNSGKKSGKKTSVSSVKTTALPVFKRVEQNAKPEIIAGEYSGFIIRYDWSRQHVLSKSPLKLQLTTVENKIAGTWTEGKTLTTAIQGDLTDDALIFNNTTYFATDHYSAGSPICYVFKDATLQIVKATDSVYLAGNLQLWSATRNEPEKPVYISLVKNADDKNVITTNNVSLNARAMPVTGLVVYPNPFENSLQVSFNLKQGTSVSISIVDLLGKSLYSRKPQVLAAGKHTLDLQPQLTSGAYVLKLNCNGQIKSAVIIKQ